MTTATLPQVWTGRSGREYVPQGRTSVRHGGMASVRRVTGRGGPVGTSDVPDGTPLALKLWLEGDEASLDHLQQEARILVELSSHNGPLAAPRLYDLIGAPLVTGLVMEWCALDLESWWKGLLEAPDAFGRLMAAMAEASRRCADYHEFFAERRLHQAAHGDISPTNILLSTGGRWLISDFGTAEVAAAEDDLWAESRVLVATENFTSPEVMFNARRRHPTAMDVWSLGATVFSLLRLRRLAVDGAVLPRNGSHSPRFRMERCSRLIETYGRDPKRFVERDLDPSAFKDPDRLPEADRSDLHEAIRGVLGDAPGAPRGEEELAEQVVQVLEGALAIAPEQRYASCRELAQAFDGLTRSFIARSAASVAVLPERELVRATRQETPSGRIERTGPVRREPRASRPPVTDGAAPQRTTRPSGEPTWEPPLWWSVAFVLLLLMQGANLLLVALTLALVWPTLALP